METVGGRLTFGCRATVVKRTIAPDGRINFPNSRPHFRIGMQERTPAVTSAAAIGTRANVVLHSGGAKMRHAVLFSGVYSACWGTSQRCTILEVQLKRRSIRIGR